MVVITNKGNFKNAFKFLKKAITFRRNYREILERYGEEGVKALSAATPTDSGVTAESWYYEIEEGPIGMKISWNNSHVNKGVNIAVILQYGHGTGTGGYVVGRDYINPALRPVFDGIASEAWKELIAT